MATEDAAWREVGHRVAVRRVGLGMTTQRQLAERAGLHKNTISKLELGQLRRAGSKWGNVEDALDWPRGKLVAMHRDIVDNPDRVPADVLERAILDTLNEAVPHVTVRQARRIAEGIARRLEQDGYLLGR
jgi:transcriptional regulator with XRE-family HTH domain